MLAGTCYPHQANNCPIKSLDHHLSLVPPRYISQTFPKQYQADPPLTHYSDPRTNYYRGFVYLSTRVSITLYIKIYNPTNVNLFLCYVDMQFSIFRSYWNEVGNATRNCFMDLGSILEFIFFCATEPASQPGGEGPSRSRFSGFAFMMQNARNFRSLGFILDNGATRTYVCDLSYLWNPQRCNGSVTSANGIKSRSTHIGAIGNLPTVLFSPDMAFNLLSQRDLEKGGLSFTYNNGLCSIYESTSKQPIMKIQVSDDDLYRLSFSDAEYLCNRIHYPTFINNLVKQDVTNYADSKHNDISTLIHARLMHMNLDVIRKAVRAGHLHGLSKYMNQLKSHHFCKYCAMSKATVQPFKGSHQLDDYKFGEYIFSDVCGPFSVKTKSGYRYFVTYICGKTRYAWLYLLKHKSEQSEAFHHLRTKVIPMYGATVKVLFSDNGGEYTSNEFKDYCNSNGVQTLHSSPRSPQQNGIAERFNRTIIEALRTTLVTSRMARSYWGEFVRSIVFVRNHLPHTSLPDSMSPIEAAFGTVPDVSRFRTLGCDCYSILDTDGMDKLLIKAQPSTLLGYAADSQSYRVLIWSTGKTAETRNVVFDEETITNGAISGVANPFMVNSTDYNHNVDKMIDPRLELLTGDDDELDSDDDDPTKSSTTRHVKVEDTYEESHGDIWSSRLRHTVRQPDRLTYERLGGVLKELSEAQIVTDYGGLDSIGFDEMNKKLEDQCLTAMETALLFYEDALNAKLPNSVEEALRSPDADEWQKSMDYELDVLESRGLWSAVPDEGQYCHDTKWVFKRKYADDLPIKWRSRLVLRGFRQRITEDYFETFSPVLRKESLRLFFALVCWMNLKCHQADVDSAFPYADLDEEIYINPPEGVSVPQGFILRLHKALYGLKQAPRAWYKLVTETLSRFGFTRCKSDPCIFIFKRFNNVSNHVDVCILAVYVDDILIAGNSMDLIKEVKQFLADNFKIKDMGPVKTMLGINVRHDIREGVLSSDQRKMTEKIVSEFDTFNYELLNSRRGKSLKARDIEVTPMIPGQVLSSTSDLPEDQLGNEMYVDVSKLPYMRLVGCLLYLMTCTRPDISFATTAVSRYMSKPLYVHWLACLHIVRYLKGTMNVGVTYSRENKLGFLLCGFSDSDWASSDLEHRRSVTGYDVFFCGGPIAWRSHLQSTVAKSSCEAEYYALSDVIDEIVFTKSILSELGIKIDKPVPIFIDNKGAVDLSGNPMYHKRTKHIDIRYHFIREKVGDGTVIILKISTKSNLADVHTKSVTKEIFLRLTPYIISKIF